MKRTLTLSLILVLASLGIGCDCVRIESTPSRPEQIRGWREITKDHGIISAGEFIVDKDHPVEGEKLGIALIKTSPAMRCSNPWTEPPNSPEATVRFYRVADKAVLLELPIYKGNTRLINFAFPIEEYGVDTISIHEINTKDEWVWFDLWK